MPEIPKVIVLRTAGTNCDRETVFAFRACGAAAEAVHVNRLVCGDVRLADYHILAIPGGFSYGDDIMSGRILANELRLKLSAALDDFIAAGKLVIGICNGFQVLVRAGLLPGTAGDGEHHQTVSLAFNDSGKFEDRWVYLQKEGRSVWTEGLEDVLLVPVAHAEGKFVPADDAVRRALNDGQVAFRYIHPAGGPVGYPFNPNGSVDDIAGICDPTGRILGMMPHPERHYQSIHHPAWTRSAALPAAGDGARIFENGVRYVREHLLKSGNPASV